MNNPKLAEVERNNLVRYTERAASLLVDKEILEEANGNEYLRRQAISAMGCLVCNLLEVREEKIADRLGRAMFDGISANNEEQLRVWSLAAERGIKSAEPKLRLAMGVTYNENGNTLPGKETDMEGVANFWRFLSLYKFGDESVLPYLHTAIEAKQGESLPYAVSHSVKLYQAGDESAYGLIKATALKARDHAFSKVIEEKEITAESASDLAVMFNTVTTSLFGSQRSEVERTYAPADIALKYLALDFLKKGDLKQTDEIQELILSGYDNAWINANRFRYGHDPEGRYSQAAKDYIGIYGENAGLFSGPEVTKLLISGGDSGVIKELEDVYSPEALMEDADEFTIADILVELHHRGDTRAHDRLLEVLSDPEDSWKLISCLEDMGYVNESIELAKKDFYSNPSYDTGLRLLNLQYDIYAMEALQTGRSSYDRDSITVINSRARHLGKLVTRIHQLELGITK